MWGNTIIFIGKKLQVLLKFPTTVFPYYVYKFSLKRLWGSPITFTILPITIKDFPYNFIVVSLTSMECTFPVNPCKHLQCRLIAQKAKHTLQTFTGKNL